MRNEASSCKPAAPATHVVAAVLIDRRGRVLIAQRPPGKHLAGAWEFPGGKIEPGETRIGGLERELREELGVTIEQPRPLLRLRHAYAFGDVLLDVWVVRRYRGEPRGLDGQSLRWCSRRELSTAQLLPADRPIVAALQLPERLRLSDTSSYSLRDFRTLSQAAAADDGAARTPQAPGPKSPRCRLRGALCEDVHEAEAAAAAGADFLAMRTVLKDAELAALCDRVSLPVFARGTTLERAWAHGASGVNSVAGRLRPSPHRPDSH